MGGFWLRAVIGAALFSVGSFSVDPRLARAQASELSSPQLDVGERSNTAEVFARSRFPLEVGGGILFASETGLHASFSLGVIPSPYSDTLVGVINPKRTGAAALLRSVLAGGVVPRLSIGYRPFAQEGFYVQTGYALAFLSTDINESQAASVVGNAGFTPNPMNNYHIDAVVHLLHAHVGWTFELEERVVIRIAGGIEATLGMDSGTTPRFTPTSPDAVRMLSERVGEELESYVKQYGVFPSLEVTLGVRL